MSETEPIMADPIRLTVVMTHPVQYMSPWFRYLEREVDELDLTVLYAATPRPEQQGEGFGRAFVWDVPLTEGYSSRILRNGEGRHRFGSETFWGLDVPEMPEAIASSRPRVVLVPGWHSITLWRAIRFARRSRLPLLYRGDSNLNQSRRGPSGALWRWRSAYLLGRFDRYLSVGALSKRYLKSFGIPDARIFDSPHCVDNELFARSAASFQTDTARGRARRDWELDERDFVLLFVGKLEPKKRPLDVIEALAKLDAGAALMIAGDGPLEARCRTRARELDVRVKHLGFLNQRELGRAYGVADCLVLPSNAGETWGLVVNEAMATGLPCIASDLVGAAPDLIEPGETGDVFPMGDTEALAERLRRLRDALAGDRETIAEACHKKAAEFSFPAAARGLVAACESAL